MASRGAIEWSDQTFALAIVGRKFGVLFSIISSQFTAQFRRFVK
jgi:hypothetical protein